MTDQTPFVLGNDKFIYHAGSNKFLEVLSGGWVDMDINIAYLTDYTVVKSYRLSQNAVVMDIRKSPTEGYLMLITLENVIPMN